MSDYNFEPDYADWWNRPDLKKEDVLWLLFGINPDDVARKNGVSTKDDITNEDHDWHYAFDRYFGRNDPFLVQNFNQHNELLEWKDDKNLLVNDAYEFHLHVSGGLLDYLTDIGDFERNKDLESYKDKDKYLFDFKRCDLDTIKAEEEAFSILLGIEPKYFLRFYELYFRDLSDPKDERGYAPYIYFSPEDKWFGSRLLIF